jgi:hypothetical protein
MTPRAGVNNEIRVCQPCITRCEACQPIPCERQGQHAEGVLPFTAAVSRGASGGPPVDPQGALLGIITKRLARGLGGGSAEAGFAVPIETVIGLTDGSGKQALGSGAALPMTASRRGR